MTHPLIVGLHGVGSNARDMAAALAPLGAIAEIVTLDGPEPFANGGCGRQFFSVAGVTEQNRPIRVAGALPPLIERLDRLADQRGIARDDIVLAGFSQGAIMTLAAVAQGLHRGRAVAIAGRLAAPVRTAGAHPANLLIVHDRDDRVMPDYLAVEAHDALDHAGHFVRLVPTRGLGHRIGPATLDAIADWLTAPVDKQAAPHSHQG